MAYTFFAAQGKTTGTSLLEPDYIDYAKKMLDEAGDKLLLPVDTVVAKEFANDAESQVVEGDIPDGWMGLDIGPKTCLLYTSGIQGAMQSGVLAGYNVVDVKATLYDLSLIHI